MVCKAWFVTIEIYKQEKAGKKIFRISLWEKMGCLNQGIIFRIIHIGKPNLKKNWFNSMNISWALIRLL